MSVGVERVLKRLKILKVKGVDRELKCLKGVKGRKETKRIYCCGPGFGGDKRPLGGAVESSPTEHPEFRS